MRAVEVTNEEHAKFYQSLPNDLKDHLQVTNDEYARFHRGCEAAMTPERHPPPTTTTTSTTTTYQRVAAPPTPPPPTTTTAEFRYAQVSFASHRDLQRATTTPTYHHGDSFGRGQATTGPIDWQPGRLKKEQWTDMTKLTTLMIATSAN